MSNVIARTEFAPPTPQLGEKLLVGATMATMSMRRSVGNLGDSVVSQALGAREVFSNLLSFSGDELNETHVHDTDLDSTEGQGRPNRNLGSRRKLLAGTTALALVAASFGAGSSPDVSSAFLSVPGCKKAPKSAKLHLSIKDNTQPKIFPPGSPYVQDGMGHTYYDHVIWLSEANREAMVRVALKVKGVPNLRYTASPIVVHLNACDQEAQVADLTKATDEHPIHNMVDVTGNLDVPTKIEGARQEVTIEEVKVDKHRKKKYILIQRLKYKVTEP